MSVTGNILRPELNIQDSDPLCDYHLPALFLTRSCPGFRSVACISVRFAPRGHLARE